MTTSQQDIISCNIARTFTCCEGLEWASPPQRRVRPNELRNVWGACIGCFAGTAVVVVKYQVYKQETEGGDPSERLRSKAQHAEPESASAIAPPSPKTTV